MGRGAGTGAGSIADFTSPFQQQVIDESLRQFDESRQGGLQNISDMAVAQGAFGGGRQGALEGQFMADTALGRAGLEAQLRAQDQLRQAQINAAYAPQQRLAGGGSGSGSDGNGVKGLIKTGLKYGVSQIPVVGDFISNLF